MTQENYITTEFPNDLRAIQKLRLANSVFSEICDDLELMGRDLALFTEEERLGNHGTYLDVQESYQALRTELAEFLRRTSHATVGQYLDSN